jgi:O-antigen/teichoic acid export membrane protein
MASHYSHSEKPSSTGPGFWRLSIAACAAVLSFCSSVLVARTLGPSAFGSYTLALWLATVMIPAIGVGMSTLTSRHIAEIQTREAPRLAAGIFYFVWQQQYSRILLYCIIYLLLIFPCSWFFGTRAPVLLLLLAGLTAPPLLLSSIVGTTLRSLRRFNLLSVIHLFGAVTTLLLILIALQVPGEQIRLLLLVSATSVALTLLVGLICIIRLLPMQQPFPPGPFLKERLTRGLSNSLLLFTLDAIVWQRAELILLAHWRSAAELGFYALSSLLSASIMDIPPSLLATCVLPLLLRYAPMHRYISADEAFATTSRYMLILTLPICVLMLLFCPALITFCFGNAYLPAVTPLRILLIASAFGSVATVSLTQLANGERKRAQVWLALGAAILHIALALPCIVLWGMIGIAVASAFARVVSAVGSVIICKKLMGTS